MKEKEKVYLGGLDMLSSKVDSLTKMPRTAVVPVIRDKKTGYLNAGAYSGSISSYKPFHVMFGPKSATTIESFKDIEEFSVAIPSKDQIDQMWVTGMGVPKGINEIEMAGWHTLPSKQIETPGIAECPINLECRKVHYDKLPSPWRAIVVGEVVGISINKDLLEKSRGEVASLIPMHENNVSAETGFYGPSVLNEELISTSPDPAPKKWDFKDKTENGKVYVGGSDIYKPENEKVLVNALYPMPAIFLMTKDQNKKANVLPMIGGKYQSTVPTLEMPVPKNSYSYDNIKRTGEFVVAMPDREMIKNFEDMEKNLPDGFEKAGLTLLPENMVDANGIAECTVNVDYKVISMKDVVGSDYAVVIATKVGVSYDKEIWDRINQGWPQDCIQYLNEFFGKYMYAVFDEGFKRKWGFHDANHLSVRPLPSYGSRYGTSWTNPWWFHFWLIELVEEGLITSSNLNKLGAALMTWNNGHGQEHLAEYFTKGYMEDLGGRLQKVFNMMAWAHRDYSKWAEIQHFINTKFTPDERDPFNGFVVQETWKGEKVVCSTLVEPMMGVPASAGKVVKVKSNRA